MREDIIIEAIKLLFDGKDRTEIITALCVRFNLSGYDAQTYLKRANIEVLCPGDGEAGVVVKVHIATIQAEYMQLVSKGDISGALTELAKLTYAMGTIPKEIRDWKP